MIVRCKNCKNKEWLATDAITKDEVLNSLRYVNEVIKCCAHPDYERPNIRKEAKEGETIMNLSISIDNFNERKDFTLGLLFCYILISGIGATYIFFSSPYIQTTYFTTIELSKYLNMIFLLFYPAITLIFLLSHIKLIRKKKEGSEED